jgi:hypothetical protein
MPPSRYKFRVGEKAIITADMADLAKPASVQRGLLDSPDQMYPGRRLQQNYINFYDLGQVNAGTDESPIWVTNPFYKSPNVTFSGSTLTAIDHFSLSDYSDLEAALFDIPLNEWPNYYRRLTYENAELFGLDVIALTTFTGEVVSTANYQPIARTGVHREKLALYNGSSYLQTAVIGDTSRWTQKGLRPFPSGAKMFSPLVGSMGVGVPYWAAESSITNEFIFTGVSGDGGMRITSTRGSGIPSDTVPIHFDTLDVSKATNVYLVPEIFLEFSAYLDGSFVWHYLDFLFAIPDRPLWNSHLVYDSTEPTDRFLFEMPSSSRKAIFSHFTDSGGTAAGWNYMQTRPGARYWKSDTSANTTVTASPALYPTVDAPTVYFANQRGFEPASSVLGVVFPWHNDPFTPSTSWDGRDMTRLIMVVNQGSDWFYCYSSEKQFSTGLSFQVDVTP